MTTATLSSVTDTDTVNTQQPLTLIEAGPARVAFLIEYSTDNHHLI